MNLPITMADPRSANLLDPIFESCLTGAMRFVVVGRGIDLEDPAVSPNRNISSVARRIDQLALPAKASWHHSIDFCDTNDEAFASFSPNVR